MQRAAGIAPDVRTYTSLISSCGFSRDPRMAMQLVRVLLEGMQISLYVFCPFSKGFLPFSCQLLSDQLSFGLLLASSLLCLHVHS